MKYTVEKAASGRKFIQTDLVVLFLLEGQMTVLYQGDRIPLRHEDILLINPGMTYETHNVKSETIFGTAIFPLWLVNNIFGGRDIILYADSVRDTKHSYQDLRSILLDLTAEYTAKTHHTAAFTQSLLLRLLDILAENYQLDDSASSHAAGGSDIRMQQIMRYIVSHMDGEISLSSLADSMYVSTSTLSRIFHKTTGVYFADYVAALRVKSSLGLLAHSDQNLTQVALSCGFSGSAAFTRTFRKIMGMAPSEYRAQTRNIENTEQQKRTAQEKAIRGILREKGYQTIRHFSTETFDIDLAGPGISYKKVWSDVINIGDLFELTRANIQFHVLMLQEQLGFSYVRVWNVFSSRMHVSDGKTAGWYNYDSIEQALDFLVQHHIRPFLDLGRRPDMAMHSDGNTIYYEEEYVHYASRSNWEDQIMHFLDEITQRYGEEEVSGWIFELSRISRNGVNDVRKSNVYEDPDFDFYNAWEFLYRTLKKRLPSARLGGLSAHIDYDMDFLESFYPRCVRNGCIPDFVSFILFPYEREIDAALSDRQISASETERTLSSEEKSIRQMRELMDRAGLHGQKLFITEWNYSISNRNYLNDSCFRSAYLLSTTEKLWGETDLTAIMAGTDWISSYIDTKGIVNGGVGLLTKDAIRKPAFFAISFLNQMGPLFLSRGRHYIATKKENGSIYILCFYFSWFRRNSEMIDERADLKKLHDLPYEDEAPLQLNLTLHGLGRETYWIKRRSVNSHAGSILDEWGKFGFAENLTREDIKHLQNVSEPDISLTQQDTDQEGSLLLTVRLEPQEIVLLHIYRK